MPVAALLAGDGMLGVDLGRAHVAYSIQVRVYYEDTDAAGIVYYANYLRFMERCRTEWLRSAGFDIRGVTETFGLIFAVRTVCVDYLKPARLSDLLTVSVAIRKFGRASLALEQQIHRGADLICRGQVRLASLNADDLKPTSIPDEIKGGINQWKMP